jgi:flagellin-like protein
MRKGISPMIAVILLIAFTVAIGGIISIFFTTFTRTQTTTVSGQTEDQVRCLNSILAVTGSLVSGGGAVTVKVSYDQGTINLDNPTAYVQCGGTIASRTVSTVLSPGASNSTQITNAACSTKDDISLIRVTANCTGPSTGNVYPVVAECKKGTGCIT